MIEREDKLSKCYNEEDYPTNIRKDPVKLFLKEVFIPILEESPENKVDVYSLLETFKENYPELGSDISLEAVYEEVASRIFHKYMPGGFNPFVLARAYDLIENTLAIKYELLKPR